VATATAATIRWRGRRRMAAVVVVAVVVPTTRRKMPIDVAAVW